MFEKEVKRVEPGDTVFIVENKFRVTRCTVVSAEADSCVIRFEKGGGCRLRKKRLYPTKELAEAAVEYIPKTEEKKEEVKREYTPWG
jgi:hypothetical protein